MREPVWRDHYDFDQAVDTLEDAVRCAPYEYGSNIPVVTVPRNLANTIIRLLKDSREENNDETTVDFSITLRKNKVVDVDY